MGLDANGSRFLLHARSTGVKFDSTLMIGRQDLHIRKSDLLSLMHEYPGCCVDGADGIIGKSNCSYADDFLRCLGAVTVDSLDHSSFEGAAICHDLNEPISDQYHGRYDVVLDGGSLEHVFDIRQAFRNCMQLVRAGGHYLGITPANNFMGHGFYQFSPEFYFRLFSEPNGFEMQTMILFEHRRNSAWYEVRSPTEVRSRVSLKNFERTYLLVIARRVADKPILLSPPQQSDYEAAWHGVGDKAPIRHLGDEAGFVAGTIEQLKRFGCRLTRRTYFEPLYFRRIR
ncbi:MAG: class I SAM-dependent methyltransferase [Planctomycetaceae bacterium]